MNPQPASGPPSPPGDPPRYREFLRQHGGREEPAFVEFGRAVGAYYDDQLANRPRCLFCERPNPARVAELTWTKEVARTGDVARGVAIMAVTAVVAAALFGAAHGAHAALSRTLTCSTHHAVCESCFRSWRLWQRIVRIGRVLGFIVGLVGSVAGLVALVAFGGPHPAGDRTALLTWGGACLAVGMTALFGYALANRAIVPEPLRHMRAGEIAPGGARLVSERRERQATVRRGEAML